MIANTSLVKSSWISLVKLTKIVWINHYTEIQLNQAGHCIKTTQLVQTTRRPAKTDVGKKESYVATKHIERQKKAETQNTVWQHEFCYKLRHCHASPDHTLPLESGHHTPCGSNRLKLRSIFDGKEGRTQHSSLVAFVICDTLNRDPPTANTDATYTLRAMLVGFGDEVASACRTRFSLQEQKKMSDLMQTKCGRLMPKCWSGGRSLLTIGKCPFSFKNIVSNRTKEQTGGTMQGPTTVPTSEKHSFMLPPLVS